MSYLSLEGLLTSKVDNISNFKEVLLSLSFREKGKVL